ncbi:MAG: hypothetical protein N2234_06100, partial [Planctomycetota bacterium]|nr:hypothetical protein [Planctomycetota bacterium]
MTSKGRESVLFPLLVGFLVTDFAISVFILLTGREFYPLTRSLANYVCIVCMALDASIVVYLVTGWNGAYLMGSLYMFFRGMLICVPLALISPLGWLSVGGVGRMVTFICAALFLLA